MIMQTGESGDQFGVNFNFNYILLQIRELREDFDEARIKLTVKDTEELIAALELYKDRVKKWQDAVGPKLENEDETAYTTRVIQLARENNYFIGKQED